LALELENA
jgi:uncharacterized protein with gpF-like domain